MFRPQDFYSWEREKRLLFVESGDSSSDPEPMDAEEVPDFAVPTQPTEYESAEAGRTPRTPANLAEEAIAAFAETAEKTGIERMWESIVENVGEDRQKQLEALNTDMEKRKKLGVLGTVATYTVGRRKSEEELLSDSFNAIAKKAVAKRNESMLNSHNKALRRIAERTSRTGAEFIFLDQKCRQIRAYLEAYRKQLEVYHRERERFERLVTSLRKGKNHVFAAEITQTEKMITRLEKLYAEEEKRARQTTDRQKVGEIKERDDELRTLLTDENREFFSKVNLSQLVLEAVGGNPELLKEAIRKGVADEAKRDVLLAAVNELTLELPTKSTTAAAYRRLRKWVKYRKNPEARKEEEQRQQALAYHYSTEILAAEKSLSAPDLKKRLEVLGNLPIGSRVAMITPGGRASYLTTAGRQTAGKSNKEFTILRTPQGGYAAVSPTDKQVWYQQDRYTKSKRYELSLPEEDKMPSRRDPTVLYLQIT